MLADASNFVDYDKIDRIEQEEEESQQTTLVEDDQTEDTLNGQSRQKSKDIYKPR